MLALSAQILSSVSVSGDKAPGGQISECTLRLGRPDGYLQIRSPKLKSEHTAPSFQSIATGWTPHMTVFGHCNFLNFKWVGPIFDLFSWRGNFPQNNLLFWANDFFYAISKENAVQNNFLYVYPSLLISLGLFTGQE